MLSLVLSASTFAPAVFAPAVFAQGAGAPRQIANEVITFVEDTYGGSPHLVVAADVDGSGRDDALMQIGTQLVMLVDPGVYDAGVLYGECTGLAVLPRAPGANADELLVAKSGGLYHVRWNQNTLAFEDTFLSGAWISARCLTVGANALGEPFVVGLRGSSVLWREDPLGDAVDFTLAFGGTGTPVELVPLNWDGAPGDELAMTTTAGLRIYDMAAAPNLGLPLRAWASWGNQDRLTRVRADGFDRVAFSMEYSNGQTFLSCLDGFGGHDMLLSFAGRILGLSAGDLDGDGLEDLAVAQEATRELVYLHHQAGGGTTGVSFDFSPGEYEFLDLTDDGSGAATNAGSVAYPALGDFDGDGDPDLLYPLHHRQRVGVQRTDSSLGGIDHTPLIPVAETIPAPILNRGAPIPLLSLPFGEPLQANGATEALFWTAWRLDDGQSPTSPQATSFGFLSLANGWEGVALQLEVPEAIGDPAVYVIEARTVDYDPFTLAFDSSAPAAIWAYTSHPDSVEDLSAIPGAGIPIVVDVRGGSANSNDLANGPAGSGGRGNRGRSLGTRTGPLGPQTIDGSNTQSNGPGVTDEGARLIPLPTVPCFTPFAAPDPKQKAS